MKPDYRAAAGVEPTARGLLTSVLAVVEREAGYEAGSQTLVYAARVVDTLYGMSEKDAKKGSQIAIDRDSDASGCPTGR